MNTIDDIGVTAALERLGQQVVAVTGRNYEMPPETLRTLALAYIAGISINILPPPVAIEMIDMTSIQLSRKATLAA